MSSPALNSNIGHFLHGAFGSTARALVDTGAYVAATFITATGVVIDTQVLPRKFRSCKAILPVRLDLASGFGITFGGSILHSTASGGAYVALGTAFPEKTFSNAGTSTSLVTRVTYQASADLRAANRFIKFKFKHKGSSTASGSDVTLGTAAIVFGGADETPASSS